MPAACRHCADYSRGRLLRDAVARAGNGLPAIEPGMPAPAGSGLSRRSFLLSARPGLRPGRLRGGPRSARGLRGRGSRVPRPPRRDRCSSPCSSTAAPTRSRCSSRPATPPMRSCARRSRCRPDSGTPFAEDGRLRWHPALEPLAQLHAEGKVIDAAGDRLHARRPVALHLAPLLGGGRDEHAADDRLARPLPRPDRHRRQPGPGPLARRPAPAGARHGPCARGRRRGPDRRTRWTPRTSGARSRAGCSRRWRALGAAPRGSTPRSRSRARRSCSRRGCASSCSRSRASRARSRTPRATAIDFPHRLAGLAAMLAAGLPLQCVTRARARACTTRTPASPRSSPAASA